VSQKDTHRKQTSGATQGQGAGGYLLSGHGVSFWVTSMSWDQIGRMVVQIANVVNVTRLHTLIWLMVNFMSGQFSLS
jgi:hypothetical protein